MRKSGRSCPDTCSTAKECLWTLTALGSLSYFGIGTSICEVYCDHISSYILHCLLFTDILSLLFDQDPQLQLIINSMLFRKLQGDLLRLDADIRPRLQKNERFFGQSLIAHLNSMLQIILTNAYDLRKSCLCICLKQLPHYLSYIANPLQYEKRSN